MSENHEQELFDFRPTFVKTLIDQAIRDERVVVVCNDSVGSSNLGDFQTTLPDRLINVGIAEQNMVGIAAGMASTGLVPFVCAAASFLTARALEQIKNDVVYNNLPVILCGISPGIAYGALGPTHHSVEDFSWLRSLPGLDIIVPVDREETQQATCQAVTGGRPVYIRIGRTPAPDLTPPGHILERGKWTKVREGSDITIIATGFLVHIAVQASDRLKAEGIHARVVNASYISPLDGDAIHDAATMTRGIITAEEANVAGGLGAGVASYTATKTPGVAMRMLGLRQFAPVGPIDHLYECLHLTERDIIKAAREILSHG